MNEDIKAKVNAEDFDEGFDRFYDETDAPTAKVIEVLDLIMKKEYALDIIAGKKKVEVRNWSMHYYDRLYDKDVTEWNDLHENDSEEMYWRIIRYSDPLRYVKKIHFHNYNNSWYLDVLCDLNSEIVCNPEQVKYVQEELDCHEFDEVLEEYIKINEGKAEEEQQWPMYFYFVLSEVLDTNLPTVEKK